MRIDADTEDITVVCVCGELLRAEWVDGIHGPEVRVEQCGCNSLYDSGVEDGYSLGYRACMEKHRIKPTLRKPIDLSALEKNR